MKKKILILTLVTIMLTSCQSAPTSIEKDGVTKAATTGEKIAQEEINQQQAIITNDTTSNVAEILSTTKTEITSEHITDNRSVNINARVIIPDITNLNTYKLTSQYITQELMDTVLESHFKENIDDVYLNDDTSFYKFGENHADGSFSVLNPIGIYETYGDESYLNQISITSSSKNLNDWDNNVFLDADNLDLEQAQNECYHFLKEIGFDEYEFYNATKYGVEIGEEFYILQYREKLDNLIVSPEYVECGFEFTYTNGGIYQIIGHLYDNDIEQEDVNIISLDSAITILYENIDNVFKLAWEGNYYNHLADEMGNMHTFDIIEITLEYVARYNANQEITLEPYWRFIVTPNGSFLDKNMILAVNAVTGEVI